MKDYKELEVWKKAIDLVIMVYDAVRKFPKEELYALADQIKRSAVSIPSNISEGASRNTTKEFRDLVIIKYSNLLSQEANALSFEGVNLDEPFL